MKFFLAMHTPYIFVETTDISLEREEAITTKSWHKLIKEKKIHLSIV
jgi:hypothetical protein